jgi:hypothetical protein
MWYLVFRLLVARRWRLTSNSSDRKENTGQWILSRHEPEPPAFRTRRDCSLVPPTIHECQLMQEYDWLLTCAVAAAKRSPQSCDKRAALPDDIGRYVVSFATRTVKY